MLLAPFQTLLSQAVQILSRFRRPLRRKTRHLTPLVTLVIFRVRMMVSSHPQPALGLLQAVRAPLMTGQKAPIIRKAMKRTSQARQNQESEIGPRQMDGSLNCLLVVALAVYTHS
jgi:hypothetical protein